ncbi:hypothetical protein RJT34_30323 [Clitoria ternatea]|uniref:Uncharacterized protein n=1 Tax=Clitoria ternatea TaxID=43366 RepID=A0AAN9EZV3_CLITE
MVNSILPNRAAVLLVVQTTKNVFHERGISGNGILVGVIWKLGLISYACLAANSTTKLGQIGEVYGANEFKYRKRWTLDLALRQHKPILNLCRHDWRKGDIVKASNGYLIYLHLHLLSDPQQNKEDDSFQMVL